MKIEKVNLLPLFGETPAGGWNEELDPNTNVHTILEIVTSEGVTGLGSVFTSQTLIEGAIVMAVRNAVGPDIELMVDAGGSDAHWLHGFKWAIQTAHMLHQYDVVWFEEALRPDDLEGYIKLTEHSPLPISACEVLTRRQSFLPWIARRAVDIIQPDVTKVGGLSEQHRIGQYADDHSILTVPHGWNTAIGLAADLQLIAAANNARWVEFITPSPYIEDLVAEPLQLDENGHLVIPDRPGLGFKWNPEGIVKHSGGRKLALSTL